MTIKDLATIICKEETESENRNINVLTHIGCVKLWSGKAKDLKAQTFLEGYEVVEIRVDNYDYETEDFPDYNRGKSIYVV